ncbi:MAG: DUF929 family protein [Actinomycetota bacterium]|nr:DUF929 family protein [Actinomycetota bacterium]
MATAPRADEGSPGGAGKPSAAHYLLLFFGLLGGLVGYFLVRDRDSAMGRRLLIGSAAVSGGVAALVIALSVAAFSSLRSSPVPVTVAVPTSATTTTVAPSPGTAHTLLVSPSDPIPPKVLHEITHVPTSVYNAVGMGTPGLVYPPTVKKGQKPLTFDGKPGVFYMGGEFCPFCAAERWAIITSLSRFGTFSGLKTMQSSPIDVYPKTQTFTFRTTRYTSPYVSAKLVEVYGQDKATGTHPVINKPTNQEDALIKKYDVGGTTRSGTIPFSDWGNKVIFTGASYNPNPLQGLSRTRIAASLKNPKNPVTKLVLGASNYMSAAVCSIDGGKPGAVCTSAGVQAAAKALHVNA